MSQAQTLLAAQYRVAQYYLDYLRSAQRAYLKGSESVGYALSMFEQEREQVKQWQAWLAAHSRHDDRAAALCSEFAAASPGLFKFRLLPREYLAWLEAALEAARRLGNRRAEAEHLLTMCVTCERIDLFQPVGDYARQALAIAHKIDDQPLVAKAVSMHGTICTYEDKLGQAQTYYEQSLAVYRAIGDQRGMAEVLNDLGVLAIIRRENATAQSYLEQSLALYKKVGDQEDIADCSTNLGFLATRLGNFSVASDYLEQALALHRVLGDITRVPGILLRLGNVAYYQGNYTLARTYYEQSLALNHTVGNQHAEVDCLHELGQVAIAQGELHAARDYFEQSLMMARSIGKSVLLPINLSSLAIVYLQLHEEDRAFRTLREALEVACRFPARTCKFKALAAAARMWTLRERPRQAARWLGLLENHPDPAIEMMDIKRDLQVAHGECEAAFSPEQFAAAWEEGKTLDLDSVIADILSKL